MPLGNNWTNQNDTFSLSTAELSHQAILCGPRHCALLGRRPPPPHGQHCTSNTVSECSLGTWGATDPEDGLSHLYRLLIVIPFLKFNKMALTSPNLPGNQRSWLQLEENTLLCLRRQHNVMLTEDPPAAGSVLAIQGESHQEWIQHLTALTLNSQTPFPSVQIFSL